MGATLPPSTALKFCFFGSSLPACPCACLQLGSALQQDPPSAARAPRANDFSGASGNDLQRRPLQSHKTSFEISSCWVLLVRRFAGGEVPVSSLGLLALLHPPLAAAPGSVPAQFGAELFFATTR